MCNSFKQDLLNGVHAFGSTTVRTSTDKDTFYAALYLSSANINSSTTAYTPDGEVSGTGYTAGGVEIQTNNPPIITNGIAHFTPSAPIVFNNVTLAQPFDSVLIYNNSAPGKNAVSVHSFGNQIITAGVFTLVMPVNNETTGLLRLV